MQYRPKGVDARVLSALAAREPMSAITLARVLGLPVMPVRAALYRLHKRHAVRLVAVAAVHHNEGIKAPLPIWEATEGGSTAA
jgi:predicted ArsR family transcriptional regulator